MSFDIRDLAASERGAAADLIRAAFGEEGAAVDAVWQAVVDRALVRAEIVVCDGDALLGHVGLSHAWLDARRALVDVLVLSPLSVAPAHQGEGIGRALLDAAVGRARDLGAPYVVLEGDPGYYGRHGWQPASSLGLEAPSRRIPAPAFQAIGLPGRGAWMTGRVIYRDVWWEHDSTGLRDPDLAQVEMNLSE